MTKRSLGGGVLLVAVAALSAGCANPDESTDPLGEDREVVVARVEHGYNRGDGEATFEVPEDGAYDLSVQFAPFESAGCGDREVRLTLVDPRGDVKLDEYSVPSKEVAAVTGCGGQAQSGTAMEAGEWQVLFRGQAPVRGVVTVERVG